MVGELGLDGIDAAASRASAEKIRDGDAESLTGFDVVVAGEIGIAEEKHAGARGCAGSVVEFDGCASKKTPELHLEQREARREAGVAVATAEGNTCGVRGAGAGIPAGTGFSSP